jgi:RNA polymerase sigma-70 factor (ECF subfamily)
VRSAPIPEASLLRRLQDGDREAFRVLVQREHAGLLRFAETFVPSRAVAEEVVQETWLAVYTGIGRFEGRSSIRTWLYRICANIARSRGERERRTVPASSLDGELGRSEPAVPLERFVGPDGRGAWAQPPARWDEIPEERFAASRTLDVVASAARALPDHQQRVFVLRDIHGWSSQEVRALLELSEVNQRVLLHRARSKVRAALEATMEVGR